nr:MAG TPA: hypothetical protein [Bacteriophage sp.]
MFLDIKIPPSIYLKWHPTYDIIDFTGRDTSYNRDSP